MKNFNFRFLTVILIALVLCFAGCVIIKPITSEAANSASPVQSVQPSTEKPTEKPSDSLLLPDNDVQASFLSDLNGDGVNETISVSLGNDAEIGKDIILSVSDNGGFNQITIDSGYYGSAFLTALQGGAPCVLVCISYEDDYSETYLCSFDGLKPVLKGDVGGCITDVSGFYVTVADWVEVLGTWSCSRIYGVTDGFAFEALNDYQISTDEREPLITKIQLPVEIWKDDKYTPESLDAGTAVYPTSTDGSTYLLFRLDDGREGMISFTRQDHDCYIGSMSEYDCFEILPYAG